MRTRSTSSKQSCGRALALRLPNGGDMKQRLYKFVRVFCLFSVLSVAPFAAAQTSSTTGAITGTVIDPSGAVVADANVKLSNETIGVSRDTKTQPNGPFTFAFMQPASGYSVTEAHSGLQVAVAKDITVLVTQVTTANIHLIVGGASVKVEVSGAAEVVQTTNPTLGATLPSTVVTNIPLATRNPFELLATDAGVSTNLSSPSATILQGSTAMFVTGSRDTANNYMLNGVDANNFEFHSLALGVVPIPNPDAVQEFRTQTSLYDATTGFSGGGNVTLITRSGTSSFHGTAYEYFRNTVLNANDFFLNRAGKPRPIMKQNQFGGSLGGPIGHPATNKGYFFVNYEGMRQRNGVAGSGSGFFPVFPSTRDANSLAAAFGVPANQIDPVALKILQHSGPFGGFLVPSGQGSVGQLLQPWVFSAPVAYSANQVNGRFDRSFSTAAIPHNLAVSYFYSKGLFFNPSGANGGAGQPYQYPLRNDNLSVRDTQMFSSTVINEIVAGFTYNIRDISSRNPVKPSDVVMTRFNESYAPALPSLLFDDGTSSFAGA